MSFTPCIAGFTHLQNLKLIQNICISNRAGWKLRLWKWRECLWKIYRVCWSISVNYKDCLQKETENKMDCACQLFLGSTVIIVTIALKGETSFCSWPFIGLLDTHKLTHQLLWLFLFASQQDKRLGLLSRLRRHITRITKVLFFESLEYIMGLQFWHIK